MPSAGAVGASRSSATSLRRRFRRCWPKMEKWLGYRMALSMGAGLDRMLKSRGSLCHRHQGSNQFTTDPDQLLHPTCDHDRSGASARRGQYRHSCRFNGTSAGLTAACRRIKILTWSWAARQVFVRRPRPDRHPNVSRHAPGSHGRHSSWRNSPGFTGVYGSAFLRTGSPSGLWLGNLSALTQFMALNGLGYRNITGAWNTATNLPGTGCKPDAWFYDTSDETIVLQWNITTFPAGASV